MRPPLPHPALLAAQLVYQPSLLLPMAWHVAVQPLQLASQMSSPPENQPVTPDSVRHSIVCDTNVVMVAGFPPAPPEGGTP